MSHCAPRYASNKGVAAAIKKALGKDMVSVDEAHGEIAVTVKRDRLVSAMTALRDVCEYQQLMEIAGVDWPDRDPRFEVVYCLLSVTKNHRIRVHVWSNEEDAVPSVTGIWPVAGWLEREVFDMYGVTFAGNDDLRRILTDYGFVGHPQRKDFPLTGYVELRYSEEEKRVKYEPVQLAQDFRNFDFMSPWEGADYVLPGDEKVIQSGEPPRGTPPQVNTPKTTEKPEQTGAGKAANKAATPKQKTKGGSK
ncbi:MAG: NADH-quinone oxidoreductase subunit C [Sphingomonadales bacterium]|jgi:NADH-quinone oxidoreductase subunit C|nr:NADH-quinone oxidoreductase subunit C [Sphingomonadales bacterium]MBK9003367.1 NADH-quinone oxidoreductase subunit C [Sphingomonadales bacterium]MBK9268646.1 NADH-quinone oxidoreductase subunit C [Sphingomonadales bacterium]MBP6434529.1 NADH-quinone oxidoreductase subunit C [Sphingorhabdus sp.]